jgi:hypothetical protein
MELLLTQAEAEVLLAALDGAEITGPHNAVMGLAMKLDELDKALKDLT